MSSTPAKTVADLQKITGLKAQYAAECYNAFGGYAPALASFVQSYASLPQSHFAKYDLASTNAKLINEELRLIYRRARELKAKSGKPDKDVWGDYHRSESAGTSSPTPATASGSAFGFGFGGAKVPAPAAAAAAPAGNAFGFGAAKPAGSPAFGFGIAPPAGAVSFGFGAAAPSVVAPSPTGCGQKEEAAAPQPEAEKKPVRYCEPKHFTGPYVEMSNFWEKEVVGRASLFNLNDGFLEANKDKLRGRLEKWVEKAAFYRQPVKYVLIEDEDEEVVRVIIKDADRTFWEPEHRAKLVSFLNAMFHEFHAYGQAMSYLAGICLLVLNEEETASVLRFVATEYIRGHWAAEAVGFATSAWVVEYFMKKLYPDVAKHLDSLNFWPDTYLQKILTGLCIHVLPFSTLFDFLDAFMGGGMRYLIRFCLAIVEHFRTELLAIQSSVEANKLYEIMRLDAHATSASDVRAILDRAPQIDLGDDGASLDLIRSQVFGEKVEPRLKRAPKTATFEPCVECDKNRPTWYSDDVGAVCDSCKANYPDITFEKY